MTKKKKQQWYLEWPSEDFDRIRIVDKPGGYGRWYVIAQVAKRHPKAEQNARLMEAAPEMKAMLQEVREYLPKIIRMQIDELLARTEGDTDK